MSCGQAIVSRPVNNERTQSFAIRDRVDPGPSANGTFVDSHKLGRGEVVKLSEGDIVRVGTTEMVFKSLWLPPAGQGMP
jgi:pSer/pThr/pTyr-binding forkhead associated (FHA) protein